MSSPRAANLVIGVEIVIERECPVTSRGIAHGEVLELLWWLAQREHKRLGAVGLTNSTLARTFLRLNLHPAV